MMEAVSRSMEQRTGRPLEQWVKLVRASGINPLDQKAVRSWLKAEHGLAQNTQWTIADTVAREAGWIPPTVEEYGVAMYSGSRRGLLPIHEAAVALALSVGEGASAQGRATYIPIVHSTQFAAVGPATRRRIRVGLRFRGRAWEDPRLVPVKGFAQATHVAYFVVPEGVDPLVGPDEAEAARMVAWLEGPLRLAWEQN